MFVGLVFIYRPVAIIAVDHVLKEGEVKRILAIGGHVIKTAGYELLRVIKANKVEMLIHNGGSLFHDFQLSIYFLQ